MRTDEEINKEVEKYFKEQPRDKSLYEQLKKAGPDEYHKLIIGFLKDNLSINNLHLETLCVEIKKITGIDKREIKKTLNLLLKAEQKQMYPDMGALRVDNYLQNVQQFHNIQPFFYDVTGMFWFWNSRLNKYEMVDDVDVMIALEKHLEFNGQTINSSIRGQYIESFKRVGRVSIPKDAPNKWIQFKDKAFSLTSKKVYEVKPNYFFTNPIPWELGETDETPTLNKLFMDWVGEENISQLYELIAYCCYSHYPIQSIFCLYGDGRNGKTSFLKIISKFIGKDNICSTELDLLVGHTSSRFESFKLYKKLVCLMGETNFGILNKSSLLKKLTGGDMIGYEMKGKKPFDDYNYAKMIIASNSLPTTEDTSEGYYRRWFVIDFPNKFPEGKEIINTIPDEEYSCLARKVTNILPKLIEDGFFTNQGDIAQRTFKYIMASNPLPMFLDFACEKDDEAFISYNELFTTYLKFLKKTKKRRISRKEFKTSLEDEGFWIEKSSKKVSEDFNIGDVFKSGFYIDGLRLKADFWINWTNWTTFPISSTHGKSKCKNTEKSPNYPKNLDILDKSAETEQIEDLIHQKCSSCGASESHYWDLGKPLCRDCYKTRQVNKK